MTGGHVYISDNEDLWPAFIIGMSFRVRAINSIQSRTVAPAVTSVRGLTTIRYCTEIG
jgi:hypothetical protein